MSACTSDFVSSKVTTAVLVLSETATLVTPGTAARLSFTTCGQAAQYQFRTASVTVVSPAKAGAASPPSARVIATSILVMGRFLSRFQDQWLNSLCSADLYLNDSALQLSVTDHLVSDAFVLIKSIVFDPNSFGPPNNDSTITTMKNKPPPGPLFSCSSVDQVSYTRAKEY